MSVHTLTVLQTAAQVAVAAFVFGLFIVKLAEVLHASAREQMQERYEIPFPPSDVQPIVDGWFRYSAEHGFWHLYRGGSPTSACGKFSLPAGRIMLRVGMPSAHTCPRCLVRSQGGDGDDQPFLPDA